MANRVSEVNAALKKLGVEERLRRGKGYYYFDGPALSWYSSSVFTNRADIFSVEQWLAEHSRLKNSNQ